MHKATALFSLMLSAMVLASCSSDDPVVPFDSLEDLTARDNLLVNFEQAFNDLEAPQLDRLLDDEFVFHFAKADVDSGLVDTTAWDRGTYYESVQNLFAGGAQLYGASTSSAAFVENSSLGRVLNAYSGNTPQPRADNIDLLLIYTPGEGLWAVDEGSAGHHEGEDWYERVIMYSFVIRAGEIDYVAQRLAATVAVRPIVYGGRTVWQIVAFRDGYRTVEGPFRDLSLRDHVLINLEEACNSLNYNEYARLLDADLGFFFSAADVDSGVVDTPAWDRTSELNATRNMFSGVAPPGRQPIDQIDLTLTYTEGEDVWVGIPVCRATTTAKTGTSGWSSSI